MTRTPALALSFLFLIVAPGSIAGLGPWWITGWRFLAAPFTLRLLGLALIGLGGALLLECFVRFAVQGRGTPAPIAPPDRLVVTGSYRHVRNPMYIAVVTLILGQAALFADIRLLGYAAVVWLGFHLFVVLYEEPVLRGEFPAEYPAFAAAVPRWLPRLRPWRGR